ncbi:MAG: hypothetical protein JJE55_02735 [Flavobacteriaceae bacterium]|nr:hypothetical protein [Flavobacteriaceae bacterium]
MVNVIDLKKATSEFFSKFCKKEAFGEFPEWSSRWEFKGSLPNNERKGCYAILCGDEVIYVGLGISNSNKGSGIGSRVSKYWMSTNEVINGERKYISTSNDITSIITLPFENGTYYLAAALEVYLIYNLKLKNNKSYSN